MFSENFQTRNVAIWHPENQEVPSKNGIITFIDALKWEVWALLTLDDIEKGKYFISGKWKVYSLPDPQDPYYPDRTKKPTYGEKNLYENHRFHFIAERENIIQENVKDIIDGIENYGCAKHINAEYYVRNHIAPETLYNALFKYFEKIVNQMLLETITPIPTNIEYHKEVLWERYKDLNGFDFLPWEQEILAYMLKEEKLDPIIVSQIRLALRRGWDDTMFFIRQHEVPNFLEEFISERVLKGKRLNDAFKKQERNNKVEWI